MNWGPIVDKLKQASTWKGLIVLLVYFGITQIGGADLGLHGDVISGHLADIAAALYGLIAIFWQKS
jgi:hypothetical protein